LVKVHLFELIGDDRRNSVRDTREWLTRLFRDSYEYVLFRTDRVGVGVQRILVQVAPATKKAADRHRHIPGIMRECTIPVPRQRTRFALRIGRFCCPDDTCYRRDDAEFFLASVAQPAGFRPVSVRIDGRRVVDLDTGEDDALEVVDVAGELEVTDPRRFRDALLCGVGNMREHGCGLLLLPEHGATDLIVRLRDWSQVLLPPVFKPDMSSPRAKEIERVARRTAAQLKRKAEAVIGRK